MTIEMSFLIALIGCIIGVAGFMRNSKNDTSADAEWRGEVKASLNNIMAMLSGINADITTLRKRITDHEQRITKVEEKAKWIETHFEERGE